MIAGDALQEAASAALRSISGLGVYDFEPLQAVVPYAVVDTGLESDWSHKSGVGRDIRLAVTIRDEGERPVRLRRLAGEAEAAIAGLGRFLPGWRIVTMQFLRTRVVREKRGTGSASGRSAAVVEFRARLLAV